MSNIIRTFKLILYVAILSSFSMSYAANYSAGTQEGSANLSGGNNSGYHPMKALSGGRSAPLPQPKQAKIVPANDRIVLLMRVVNPKLQRVPVYIWVTGLNRDGTSKKHPAKKGDAAKGIAQVKYVKLGDSYQIIIKPRNGKNELHTVTISRNNHLKNYKGQLVYEATIVLHN